MEMTLYRKPDHIRSPHVCGCKALFSWLLVLEAMFGYSGVDDSPRYPVSGAVLIDGEPLREGTIRFVPKSGRPSSSAIQSDGSFRLIARYVDDVGGEEGVPPGQYRVSVSASEILDERAEEVRWLAPSRYADFRTADLNVNVDGPEENLIINLTWEREEESDVSTPPQPASADEASKDASSNATQETSSHNEGVEL